MKCDVVVIGCGIVGSAIAYELARANLTVIVVDASDAAAGSTGAALGVMVAIASQQVGGDVAELRLQSWAKFEPLIANLETDLARSLPVNRRGILRLLQPKEVADWAHTLSARQTAGYSLQHLSSTEIATLQPQIQADMAGGIYSSQDRQIEPKLLTHALIQAARQRGVQFFFHQSVTAIKANNGRINAVYTPDLTISAGTVVVAAGLGSKSLGSLLDIEIPVQAVKGQALQVYTPNVSLGPVVMADDVYLVPLTDGSIWIGATVEFAPTIPQPTLQGFQTLITQALQICPDLADAQLQASWSGLRPRPSGQRAPILGFSPVHSNVVIATGHYRNGVLLAPITAAIVQDLVLQGKTSICDIDKFSLTN